MKVLVKKQSELIIEKRCDIDYHSDPIKLQIFNTTILKRIDEVSKVIKENRNPSNDPEKEFKYIDISSIDIHIGRIENHRDLIGSEAPSRARKIIKTNDLIVSTCRPTRGAIAIVDEVFNDEICSTGFSVWRADHNVILPEYLHWALRLESTTEQFRKWSTGSSYPAILDEDIAKTLIPVPNIKTQKKLVRLLNESIRKRNKIIASANEEMEKVFSFVKDEVREC